MILVIKSFLQTSGGSVDGAVDSARSHWDEIDSARTQVFAQEQRSLELDQWVQVHDLASHCRGRSGEALRKAVAKAVAVWEERKAREAEANKTKQSVWDASDNDIMDVPEPEPEPEPDPEAKATTSGVAQASAFDKQLSHGKLTFGDGSEFSRDELRQVCFGGKGVSFSMKLHEDQLQR